jgi:single-strand DNA-binding protein
MGSFNKIILVGHLGRDPELRYTPQGTPVCDFSVATTERRKDKSGDFQDLTTWFRVSFWGRQAEVASQYLTKGKQVYIEGRLSQREWQDKDGNTRTSLEVNGSDLQFIGPRGDEASGGAGGGYREGGGLKEERPASRASAPEERQDSVSDDDIPF